MDQRVSFVVPCYNYGRFVGQAIESLLQQTFASLEVIVVDDASTDDTADVLNRYAGEPRVSVIRHVRNMGHIRSYNEGLGSARGDFIGLMSADDFCLRPDAVERQVACFDKNPSVGFVYSSVAFTDPDGRTIWVKQPWPSDRVEDRFQAFRQLIYENYVPHSGTLVRRICHDEVGFYDIRLPHSGDWDLWLRLLARYDAGFIADPLFGYRIHPENMHHAKMSVQTETLNNVIAVTKGFEHLPADAPASIRGLRKDAIQRAWLRSSAVAGASGRKRRAWAALSDAVRRSPSLAVSSAFYGSLARICLLTVFGRRSYDALAALRRRGDTRRTVPAAL